MKLSINQLRTIVREAVEANLKEQEDTVSDSEGGMDEDWGSSYSTGGSGGNRHGDSTDYSSSERSYNPETSDERQRRIDRDSRSSQEFSDSYNQSSRYDESRKPKGLTLEALRKLVIETIEEDFGSSYSTGGSGGNRHGDSTDDERPERSFRPESPSDREERLRRDDEREAYYGSRDTGWNESYRPKGKLNLENLRKLVREAIAENLEEQGAAAPAPPAPPVAAPAVPAAAPAAAPPVAKQPAVAVPAAAAPPAAPMAEAIRRIVRETIRKNLQEKKEEGKWMQKAGKEMEAKGTKGALHKQLGKKEGEKLSKSELETKKAALQKKGEGDKKLSAEDRKLLRRIIFALNAMKAKKD